MRELNKRTEVISTVSTVWRGISSRSPHATGVLFSGEVGTPASLGGGCVGSAAPRIGICAPLQQVILLEFVNAIT